MVLNLQGLTGSLQKMGAAEADVPGLPTGPEAYVLLIWSLFVVGSSFSLFVLFKVLYFLMEHIRKSSITL